MFLWMAFFFLLFSIIIPIYNNIFSRYGCYSKNILYAWYLNFWHLKIILYTQYNINVLPRPYMQSCKYDIYICVNVNGCVVSCIMHTAYHIYTNKTDCYKLLVFATFSNMLSREKEKRWNFIAAKKKNMCKILYVIVPNRDNIKWLKTDILAKNRVLWRKNGYFGYKNWYFGYKNWFPGYKSDSAY